MQRPSGLTLVELVTTLAVAAILLALAGPPLSRLLAEARVLNGLHSLTLALGLARLTAVTEGVPVTVCPSADGRRCRFDLTWDEGWIVYRDPGRQPQPETPEALILHQPAPGSGLQVRSSIGRHRVRYQPTGFSGGSNLTLRVCAGRPARHAGNVVVSLAGRPRTQRVRDADTPCPFSP
jgi:type IV fimbrial biogenesis protein FimT